LSVAVIQYLLLMLERPVNHLKPSTFYQAMIKPSFYQHA